MIQIVLHRQSFSYYEQQPEQYFVATILLVSREFMRKLLTHTSFWPISYYLDGPCVAVLRDNAGPASLSTAENVI